MFPLRGDDPTGTGSGAGVAHAAHVGGFVAGIALVLLFARRLPRGSRRAAPGAMLQEPHERGW